jgi:hypothetical protein
LLRHCTSDPEELRSQGVVGAMSGVAASISTLATGFRFQGFGTTGGFLTIAGVATAATALIAVFVAETKPGDYGD